MLFILLAAASPSVDPEHVVACGDTRRVVREERAHQPRKPSRELDRIIAEIRKGR